MAFRCDAPNDLSTPFPRRDDRADDPRVKRIRQADPSFDPTGKSDTYLDRRVALLDGATAETPANVAPVEIHEDTSEDLVAKARREMQERHANAWKPKTAAPTQTAEHADEDVGPVERARREMNARHARAWRRDGGDDAVEATETNEATDA